MRRYISVRIQKRLVKLDAEHLRRIWRDKLTVDRLADEIMQDRRHILKALSKI